MLAKKAYESQAPDVDGVLIVQYSQSINARPRISVFTNHHAANLVGSKPMAKNATNGEEHIRGRITIRGHPELVTQIDRLINDNVYRKAFRYTVQSCKYHQ